MAYPAGMDLESITSVLRELAPEHLAEPWDSVGLQVGWKGHDVDRAMICIDLTEPVLEEAIEQGADLVVAYHPPIFKPLSALTDRDGKQRIVLRAARAGIAIYSPHTALDAAEGGVNDWLAAGIGEGTLRPIKPTAGSRSYKLVVFVPPGEADNLRKRLSDAGAGQIGHYSECSFSTPGEGTFRGDETTSPAVGEAERFERAEELRMEMLLPEAKIADVVAALRFHHPYEEPAFDLIPLAQTDTLPTGPGRVLELDEPIDLDTLVERVRERLGAKYLDVGEPVRGGPIRRVGMCPGAGGSMLPDAGPLDAYLTGEMRHHDILAATQANTAILLAGHTETERPYLPTYRQRIIEKLGEDVTWTLSERDAPPSTIR
ncbi:MAG: Nif3-like dinuclear metal center hexameric protein [Phycisphaeraceae bacterium]